MASASQEELPIEEVDRMLAELDEDGYVSDSDDDGDVTPVRGPARRGSRAARPRG